MIKVDLEEPGEVVPIHKDHIVVSSVSVHPRFRLSRFETYNDNICSYMIQFSDLKFVSWLLNGLGKAKVHWQNRCACSDIFFFQVLQNFKPTYFFSINGYKTPKKSHHWQNRCVCSGSLHQQLCPWNHGCATSSALLEDVRRNWN